MTDCLILELKKNGFVEIQFDCKNNGGGGVAGARELLLTEPSRISRNELSTLHSNQNGHTAKP